MKAINPNEIKDNFIELIGKEWMLVSAGDKEKFNMMTASWGGVGVLWNRPVVFAFIRPERYTREFIDAKNEFTITFLGPEHRKAHSICGSKSGREIDKVEATGLTPYFTEAGNPVFEEARLTLECKDRPYKGIHQAFCHKSYFLLTHTNIRHPLQLLHNRFYVSR